MGLKLSILIPSLISRAESLNALRAELDSQAIENNLIGEVEVLTHIDNGELSIGKKRNELLQQAKGEYTCFIDDDDEVSKDYLKLIFDALKINPDCCSLTGLITWDGEREEIFEHSINYSAYKTNEHNYPKYERYPNHLNVIKSDIAKRFSFLEINHGEDTEFATQIFNAGAIKTEAEIKEVLYHYKFKTKK